VSITTASTSINEKAEQISTETIWNFNQFRTSTSRIIRSSNPDSAREELMKADKCFNCDEFDHLSRDCLKSRKFRIVEMNVEDDAEKSRKE
jgi:hypothetical protein